MSAIGDAIRGYESATKNYRRIEKRNQGGWRTDAAYTRRAPVKTIGKMLGTIGRMNVSGGVALSDENFRRMSESAVSQHYKDLPSMGELEAVRGGLANRALNFAGLQQRRVSQQSQMDFQQQQLDAQSSRDSWAKTMDIVGAGAQIGGMMMGIPPIGGIGGGPGGGNTSNIGSVASGGYQSGAFGALI